MTARLIRRPFRGSLFYEWQIGPMVFFVRLRDNPHPGRWFHVERDPFWRQT